LFHNPQSREGVMSLECKYQEAVDVIGPGKSAFEAAERMHQRSVGALVVVDNTNAPVGILTDRDLIVRVMAAGLDPHLTAVREIMTASPTTALPTITIENALATMQAGGFRRLPLVNQLGHLAGIITLDDILMSFSKHFVSVKRILEGETPAAAAR
jgi:CBS domain-containing protein